MKWRSIVSVVASRMAHRTIRAIGRYATRGLSLAVLACACQSLPAATFRVLPEESYFLVVTHKGGFAAGLAHDHLVAANGYVAHLAFDPDDPVSARFELELEAEKLVIDDPGIHRRLFARLSEVSVLGSAPKSVSGSTRRKIRKAMLGHRQLDAESFPTIRVSATVSGPLPAADIFSHEVLVVFEVRGQRAERQARVRYTYRKGRLEVEALGEFLFTDFGIKPYSAMLGAVRNQDRFHVYLRLTAVEEGEGQR